MFYQKKLSDLLAISGVVLISGGTFGACSSAPKNETAEGSSPSAPVAQVRTQVETLNARLSELEGKLASLNGKLESLLANPSPVPAATDRMERSAAAPVTPSVIPTIPHPAQRAGIPVVASRAPADPDAGYVADGAVQDYRKALVLLQARQNSEAVLAFSEFLEQYPDHPLAGSAQFYVGEAYFLQREYRLALQEYRRVLTSYDRSPLVPETLRKMAMIEDHLNMKEEAKAHRQLLSSLFPQSPAAAAPNADATVLEPSAPVGLDGPPLTAPLEQNQPDASQ